MLWLILLHIAALLCWSGALLYLPALAAGRLASGDDFALQRPTAVGRALFTSFATPAALLAIFTGTAMYLLADITSPWLVMKLTLVGGLVICHVLTGLLVLAREREPQRNLNGRSLALGLCTPLLIVGIFAIVLAKPDGPFQP